MRRSRRLVNRIVAGHMESQRPHLGDEVAEAPEESDKVC